MLSINLKLQGGIYHFRNLDGVFKTAVIFPLHKVRCSIILKYLHNFQGHGWALQGPEGV